MNGPNDKGVFHKQHKMGLKRKTIVVRTVGLVMGRRRRGVGEP